MSVLLHVASSRTPFDAARSAETTRPEEPLHFPTEDSVRKMTWSPRGTRLAVLLRRGDGCLYGVAPTP